MKWNKISTSKRMHLIFVDITHVDLLLISGAVNTHTRTHYCHQQPVIPAVSAQLSQREKQRIPREKQTVLEAKWWKDLSAKPRGRCMVMLEKERMQNMCVRTQGWPETCRNYGKKTYPTDPQETLTPSVSHTHGPLEPDTQRSRSHIFSHTLNMTHTEHVWHTTRPHPDGRADLLI